MRAFVQQKNQAQKQVSSSLAKSRTATPRLNRCDDRIEDLIPEWQQTIAERSAHRSAQPDSKPPEDGSPQAPPPRLGWDFSRISIHPAAPAAIQTKLAVNQPGGEYEREANRLADRIMRMAAAPAAMPPVAVGTRPRVQRQCACGGTCPKCQANNPNHEHLRTKPARSGNLEQTAVPPLAREVLRSPGQPFDAATRAFMQPRFGFDFSNVRLHSSADAGRSAKQMAAKAYTVGNKIVFGANRFAPDTQEGRRLIAHELAHVVQQSAPSDQPPGLWGNPAPDTVPHSIAAGLSHLPPGTVQRDDDTEGPNPWGKLSPAVRAQAEELWEECDDSIGVLDEAQMIRSSTIRSSWIDFLRTVRTRIGALENDTKFREVKNSYNDFESRIGAGMATARTEWFEVKQRYLDEHRWLLSPTVKSTDSTEAAKYLEDIYRNTENHIPFLTTEDDYAELKRALDKQEYIRIGVLRGTRIRARQLFQMMRTVADLLRKGEDANKFIPEWSDRVLEEAAYLDSFAKLAKGAGREYAQELADLRDQLLERQKETAKVGPPEESWLEKGEDLVKGGVEAISGIFVEAAKEAVDLAQIVLHFETFGKYEPRFISDMAKAAEEGATTGDLLKQMVMGAIDTPSRFLKACRDGDWEAIGKETVNLYMLAKTIKEAPETIKKIKGAVEKLPELLAKTQESLGILRQRTVALGLKNEGRFVPEPAPKPINKPAAQEPPPPKPAPAPRPNPAPAAAPTPAPTVKQGGGQGSGKPTGMLRDSDAASPSVKVDASHPVFKNKVPANDPPPRAQAQVAKVAVNAAKDAPHAQQIDSAHTPSPSNQGANRPRATAGNPPGSKPPATVTPPSNANTPTTGSSTTAGANKPKPQVTQAKPTKPAPGTAPLDVPLAEDERGLTTDQLRRKHMLEKYGERQSRSDDAVSRDTKDVRKGHETGKAGAGMAATPKHHVFPQAQAHRRWFEQRGFTGDYNIDQFTVEIVEARHQAVHGGGNYQLGRTTGFDWNSRIMNELEAAENALQGRRLLRRDEIFAIAIRLMREYDIPQHFVPYR